MSKSSFQRPRGTADILPAQWPIWRQVIDVFETNVLAAGYGRISTPAIEQTSLFVRSVGDDTEIVSKELYTFEDKSGHSLSLRPEGTAPVVRAYLENGLANQPKPLKLYIVEPMWRYDRPQAGRQRQFYQAGVEVFGSSAPVIDAQVIALAARIYQQLGLSYSLQINSLGNTTTRKKFAGALTKYLSGQKNLPELVQQQLATNPLRVLDSKDPQVIKLIDKAPSIIDFLDRGSAHHFQAVLEYLDRFGIEYDLNPHLVRGLDYYTGTLFEFWGSNQGMQNSIGGGGRYDELIEQLGGKHTSAVGFGLGLERIIIEMTKNRTAPPAQPKQVYLVTIGEEAKEQAFVLEQQLLDAGLMTVNELTRKNLADQLARASKLGVHYALIIGKKELLDNSVIVKDMLSGNQEVLPQNRVATELVRRFGSAT